MKKIVFLSFTLLLLSACQTKEPQMEAWTLGNPSVPTQIELFADLECPSCAEISPQIERLVKEDPDLARLEFHHFPLSIHPHAFIAAEGAECAGDQGQFWDFVDLAYKNQVSLNEDYLYKMASSLDLNSEEFETCMKDRKYREKIQEDMKEGVERNISVTPTIFVNGEKVNWVDIQNLERSLSE